MNKLIIALMLALGLLASADATAAAGDFCGGIAGVQCSTGFQCKLDGNYPDAGGQCVAQFCGGIAAFQCPTGFQCKLDGSYPDAGGHCEKPKARGLLESCGFYGPDCASNLKCWISPRASGINPQGVCWFR